MLHKELTLFLCPTEDGSHYRREGGAEGCWHCWKCLAEPGAAAWWAVGACHGLGAAWSRREVWQCEFKTQKPHLENTEPLTNSQGNYHIPWLVLGCAWQPGSPQTQAGRSSAERSSGALPCRGHKHPAGRGSLGCTHMRTPLEHTLGVHWGTRGKDFKDRPLS